MIVALTGIAATALIGVAVGRRWSEEDDGDARPALPSDAWEAALVRHLDGR